MPKKVYVNLEGGDPAKGEGREVLVKLTATETKPGASDGKTVYLFIDPDPKNEDATHLSGAHRAGAFHTDPPYIMSATFKDKKGEAMAKLSLAGGDKFGFKYGKKADGSDTKAVGGDKAEVWRKIYVSLGHMAGCKQVDPTSLNGKLAKVFLEIEKDGALREIPHVPNTVTPGPAVSELGKLAGTLKFPGQTIKIVFVDRIADPGEKKWDFEMTPAQVGKGRQFRVLVKDDQLTWPYDDWLTSGKIYLFDSNGQRMADEPIHPFVSRAKVKRSESKSSQAAPRYHEHKEGLATNRILFDLRNFPNIERWEKEKGGTMKVYLGVKIIESVAGGMANSKAAWVVIATRSGWTYKAGKDMVNVTMHEIGHVIGNVLRFISRWTADKGTYDDHDENSFWYEKHGGVGNHCHSGSTLKQDTCEAGASACVMFHATPGLGSDFCESCQAILKRAPLSKLGRVNVWGEAGWTE